MKSRTHTPRVIRHRRIRAKLAGTSAVPRLAVFRSLKHISCQLIDDVAGRTLASASDSGMGSAKLAPTAIAAKVGERIAEQALAAKVTRVIFDRGGYAYHGRVKALAEAARAAGLQF